MTIVIYAHRPKRPPKKPKAQPAALNVPTIVRAGKKAPVAATSDDRKLAIVTAKNPRRSRLGFGEVPDMTREEHKRRGDAADALFREMKR